MPLDFAEFVFLKCWRQLARKNDRRDWTCTNIQIQKRLENMHNHLIASSPELWLLEPNGSEDKENSTFMSLTTCDCLSEEMSWNINLASESFIKNVGRLQESCFVPINFAQGTIAVEAGLLVLSLQEA